MTRLGVLLAAGGGSRFDGPTHKLLAPFRGRPLWTWAHEAMVGAGIDRTLVVTGAVPLDVPAASDVATNDDWPSGLASSLQVALRWADAHGFDAVVVGLADEPLVGASSWRAVADATSTPIAVAARAGRPGHPVRLASEVWPLLPTAGDRGAREVMRAHPRLVTRVPCTGQAADVDTRVDLEQLDRLRPVG